MSRRVAAVIARDVTGQRRARCFGGARDDDVTGGGGQSGAFCFLTNGQFADTGATGIKKFGGKPIPKLPVKLKRN